MPDQVVSPAVDPAVVPPVVPGSAPVGGDVSPAPVAPVVPPVVPSVDQPISSESVDVGPSIMTSVVEIDGDEYVKVVSGDNVNFIRL